MEESKIAKARYIEERDRAKLAFENERYSRDFSSFCTLKKEFNEILLSVKYDSTLHGTRFGSSYILNGSDAIAYFSYRMTLIHIDNEHSQLSSDALSSMVVEYLDPFRKIRESLYAMIDASHLYTAAACRHIQLFSNESRILAIESSALAIALLVPKVIDTMEKDDVNRIVLESIVRECRDISLCIKEMHEINITN